MIRNDFGSIDEMVKAPFRLDANRVTCAEKLGSPGAWSPALDHFALDRGWYGGTVEQGAQRVTHGWPEGADKALAAMEQMNAPTPRSAKRRIVHEDMGDELDIHSVYRGDFQHAWTSRKRRPVRGSQLIRLATLSDINADVTAEQLFWRGAALIKLADLLAGAGYSVEILGVTSSTNAQGYGHGWGAGEMDGCMLVTYTIKESRSPLDVNSLAGVVCNPAFDRLYAWRMLFQFAPQTISSIGSAGSDKNLKFVKQAKLAADGVATFITPYDMLSQKGAERFVSQCIEVIDNADHLTGAWSWVTSGWGSSQTSEAAQL